MKRVVITGAGGFVGSWLVQHYRDIWDITPLDHSRLELTDREAVHAALAGAAPQLVIHTAALADTGYCENHPLESFEVNLQAPAALAEECAALGAKLVLFSSDQVYNGTRRLGPLPEDAPLDPVNVYGRHKWVFKIPIMAITTHKPYPTAETPSIIPENSSLTLFFDR